MSDPHALFHESASAIEALPPLREVIAAHALSAQKALGQNFLLDLNITDKIVRTAQEKTSKNFEGVNVFEIGPGPGGLTRSLLKSKARKVTAIEFDFRAVEALKSLKEVAGDRLEIIQKDALETDLTGLSEGPRAIVANLPYNIATPLLVDWLKQIRSDESAFQSMTLMFQKEVAQRIVAPSGGKAFGRLAVISQWLCGVHILFDLPPSAFTPPPKVTSSVVHFTPKDLAFDVPTFENVEQVTAAAFNQRRKMIRSSLKAYMEAIESLGLDPQARAENLSVADFIAIAGLDKKR